MEEDKKKLDEFEENVEAGETDGEAGAGGERKEEEKMLLWNEDTKSILTTILVNLGFKTTKKETLFVKDIGDDALFCDFAKNAEGSFWTKQDADPTLFNEYEAFRVLQKGKGIIDRDEVVTRDADGLEYVIPINTPFESIPQKSEGKGKIEYAPDEQHKIVLNEKLMKKIKGKMFPTIDAVVDAMHKAGILKEWRIELIKAPTKILPEKKTGEEEPEDINSDAYLTIAKATVILSNGHIFESLGDAHPLSVSDSMRPHVIRMADTRALARALRFAGNISGSMAEEFKEGMA